MPRVAHGHEGAAVGRKRAEVDGAGGAHQAHHGPGRQAEELDGFVIVADEEAQPPARVARDAQRIVHRPAAEPLEDGRSAAGIQAPDVQLAGLPASGDETMTKRHGGGLEGEFSHSPGALGLEVVVEDAVAGDGDQLARGAGVQQVAQLPVLYGGGFLVALGGGTQLGGHLEPRLRRSQLQRVRPGPHARPPGGPHLPRSPRNCTLIFFRAAKGQ
jgi:hypothetical protein